MADAYAGLFHGAAETFRQRDLSTQPPTAFSSGRKSSIRSYSQESFVDLSDEFATQNIERRRSSLSRRDHPKSICRNSPNSGQVAESTSDLVKNRMKVWWNNVKYGWTVISPGTPIDMSDLNGNEPIYLLGKVYHNRDDPSSFRNFFHDFNTRIWFTYRQDFAPICETGHQSDSGWGCMLRSAQMLLAEAFVLHLLGRGWRWKPPRERSGCGSLAEHGVHRQIISWFGDGANAAEAPFGIHSLIKAAGQISKKKAGDWFGPSTAAYLLKRCMEEAASTATSKSIFEQMTVYIAQDCTIYTEDVVDLCTSNPDIEWKSVILLVPVRLGGETINVNYVHSVKEVLADDRTNCIGVIGGKPKHSLYFIGFQGDKLVFLDPHYLQNSVNTTKSSFSLSSFHCTSARKISFSKLDPSATIGFYCKTRRDFDVFARTIQEITQSRSSRPRGDYPIFMVTEGSSAITNHSDALNLTEDRVLKVHRHVLTENGTFRRESEEYVVL